jgi:hypothetical protein
VSFSADLIVVMRFPQRPPSPSPILRKSLFNVNKTKGGYQTQRRAGLLYAVMIPKDNLPEPYLAIDKSVTCIRLHCADIWLRVPGEDKEALSHDSRHAENEVYTWKQTKLHKLDLPGGDFTRGHLTSLRMYHATLNTLITAACTCHYS